MLRCHSVPDCSSPSSHRRGHPCRKTFGIFACFPSLNLLMQKHIMNSGQKFCLVVIFRSPSSSNLVFLLLCIDCMVCTSMPFQSLTWQNPASAWCLPCVATNLRNKPTQQQNQLYEIRLLSWGIHQQEPTKWQCLHSPRKREHLTCHHWLVGTSSLEWDESVCCWMRKDPKIMMGFW